MNPPPRIVKPAAVPYATVLRLATVVILLVTVAGLFTLAKNGQYYPKSNPAEHVSVSIKMNVHSVAPAVEEPRHFVARLVMPPPVHPERLQRLRVEQAPPRTSIGVTVSMQHRSPPSAPGLT